MYKLGRSKTAGSSVVERTVDEQGEFSTSLLIALEPRIMFDGAAVAGADAAADGGDPPPVDETAESGSPDTPSEDTSHDATDESADKDIVADETTDEGEVTASPATEQTPDESTSGEEPEQQQAAGEDDAGPEEQSGQTDDEQNPEDHAETDEAESADEPIVEAAATASSDVSDNTDTETDDAEPVEERAERERPDSSENEPQAAAAETEEQTDTPEPVAVGGAADGPREIVFIDSHVPDYELILAGLEFDDGAESAEDTEPEPAAYSASANDAADGGSEDAGADGGESADGPAANIDGEAEAPNTRNPGQSDAARYGIPEGVQVVMLDAERDGLEQMAEVLAAYQGIAAVHVISHGNKGEVKLGNVILTSDNVGDYADELAVIGAALSADGDILIYGCNVADGEDGETLLDAIAAGTGADVAGSIDDTGTSEYGGDWDLEFRTGEVDAAVSFDDALMGGYNNLLAMFVVDVFHDEFDGDFTPGDRSLREAVAKANLDPGVDTIFLKAGSTYSLTRNGGGDTKGDLDIYSNLVIDTVGTGTAVIEQTEGYRVMEIHGDKTPGLDTVTLNNIVITGGDSKGPGGGILNHDAELVLEGSYVEYNHTDKSGGGIANDGGSVELKGDSGVSYNSAGRHGGGIANSGGEVVLRDSSHVSHNYAGEDGGGIYNKDGTVHLYDWAYVNDNRAADDGGGIYNYNSEAKGTARVQITDTAQVGYNVAGQHGGGVYNDQGKLIMTADLGSLYEKERPGIVHNWAGEDGGGVYNDNGWFESKGGDISYNTAGGGNVIFADATTSFDGFGQLSKGKGGDTGAGFFEWHDFALFIMNGGNGGGIANVGMDAVSNLYHTTVTDNRALGNAIGVTGFWAEGDVGFKYSGALFKGKGGVDLDFNVTLPAEFPIQVAFLDDGARAGHGGGVYNEYGTLNIRGGEIAYNEAGVLPGESEISHLPDALFSHSGVELGIDGSLNNGTFLSAIDSKLAIRGSLYADGFYLMASQGGNGGGIANIDGLVNINGGMADIATLGPRHKFDYTEIYGNEANGISVAAGLYSAGVHFDGRGTFEASKGASTFHIESKVDSHVHGVNAAGLGIDLGILSSLGAIAEDALPEFELFIAEIGLPHFDEIGLGGGIYNEFTGGFRMPPENLVHLEDTGLPVGGNGVPVQPPSTLNISHAYIEANRAVFGGGIANVNGIANIDHSSVSDNTAFADGGGIFNRADLRTARIPDFAGPATGWVDGGKMMPFPDPGTITVHHSAIDHNVAGAPFVLGLGSLFTQGVVRPVKDLPGLNAENGGVMDHPGDTFVIRQQFETLNAFAAIGLGGYGGGVYNDGGRVDLYDSTVHANVANGAFLSIGIGDGVGQTKGSGSPLFDFAEPPNGVPSVLNGGLPGIPFGGLGIIAYSNDLFGDLSLEGRGLRGGDIVEEVGFASILGGVVLTDILVDLFDSDGNGGFNLTNLPGVLDDVGGLLDQLGFFDLGIGKGGGIYNDHGEVNLHHSSVSFNRAGAADLHSASGPGGLQISGLFATGGELGSGVPGPDVAGPNLTGTPDAAAAFAEFSRRGPAVFTSSSHGHIYDFSGPMLSFAAGGNGGGIYNEYGDVLVTDGSVVAWNEAANGYVGAGMFQGSGHLHTEEVTFLADDRRIRNPTGPSIGGFSGEDFITTLGRFEAQIDLPTTDIRGTIFREGVGLGGGIYNQGTELFDMIPAAINGEENGNGMEREFAGSVIITGSFDPKAKDGKMDNGNTQLPDQSIVTDGSKGKGPPPIQYTAVSHNLATDGGGVYNKGGYVEVSDEAEVSYNDALRNGGGIFNDATLDRRYIQTDFAAQGLGFNGVMSGGAVVNVDNGAIVGNRAGMQTFVFGKGSIGFSGNGSSKSLELGLKPGGGFESHPGPGPILNTEWHTDGSMFGKGSYEVFAPGGDGGGLYNLQGDVFLTDSFVAFNQAYGGYLGHGGVRFGVDVEFDARVHIDGRGIFAPPGFEARGPWLFGDLIGGHEALPGAGSMPAVFGMGGSGGLFPDGFFVPDGFFKPGEFAEGALIGEGHGGPAGVYLNEGGNGGGFYNLAGNVYVDSTVILRNEAGALHDLSTIFVNRDYHERDHNPGFDGKGKAPYGKGLGIRDTGGILSPGPDTLYLDNSILFGTGFAGRTGLGTGLFNTSGDGRYHVDAHLQGIGSGGNGGGFANDGGYVWVGGTDDPDLMSKGSLIAGNIANTYQVGHSEASGHGFINDHGRRTVSSLNATGLIDSGGPSGPIIDFLPPLRKGGFAYGQVMEADFEVDFHSHGAPVFFVGGPGTVGTILATSYSPLLGVNGQGGGLWNGFMHAHGDEALVEIDDSLIIRNSAYVGGGIANTAPGHLNTLGTYSGGPMTAHVDIDDSAVVFNRALRAGGGIFNHQWDREGPVDREIVERYVYDEGKAKGLGKGFLATVDVAHSDINHNSAGGLWQLDAELHFNAKGALHIESFDDPGKIILDGGMGTIGKGAPMPDGAAHSKGDLMFNGGYLYGGQLEGDGGGVFNHGGWVNVHSDSHIDDNHAYGAFSANGFFGLHGEDPSYQLKAQLFEHKYDTIYDAKGKADFHVTGHLHKGQEYYQFYPFNGLYFEGPYTNGIAEGGGFYNSGGGLFTIDQSTVNGNDAGAMAPGFERALFGKGSLLSEQGAFRFAGKGPEYVATRYGVHVDWTDFTVWGSLFNQPDIKLDPAAMGSGGPGMMGGKGGVDARLLFSGEFDAASLDLLVHGVGGNGGGGHNTFGTTIITGSVVDDNYAQGQLRLEPMLHECDVNGSENGHSAVGFDMRGWGRIDTHNQGFHFPYLNFRMDPIPFEGHGSFFVGGVTGNGGGMFNGGFGETYIYQSTFGEPDAAESGGNQALVGGGLFNTGGGYAHINRSLFRDNWAVAGGGVANGTALSLGVPPLPGGAVTGEEIIVYPMAPPSTVVAFNSTFSGNQASAKALGAFDVFRGPTSPGGIGGIGASGAGFPGIGGVDLYHGGGVYNGPHGAAIFINDTIAHNSANRGGGIYVEPARGMAFRPTLAALEEMPAAPVPGAGDVFLGNTLIGNNTATMEIGNDVLGPVVSFGNNLIEDPAGALPSHVPVWPGPPLPGFHPNDILNRDPVIGALADNGGPTLTHRLLDGSPAINAGSAALLDLFGPYIRPFDQRGEGFPREIENVDIGAYERGRAPDTSIPTTVETPGAGSTPTTVFIPPEIIEILQQIFIGRNEHFTDHEDAYPRVSRPIELPGPFALGFLNLGIDEIRRLLGVTFDSPFFSRFGVDLFDADGIFQELLELLPLCDDGAAAEDGLCVPEDAGSGPASAELDQDAHGAAVSDMVPAELPAAPGFSAQLTNHDVFDTEQGALLAAVTAVSVVKTQRASS